jgi:acetyl-CoA/propionyl-CoA carboxylase biotin carboxyl carrier protein
MPGVATAVLVAEGDVIAAGQKVAIIEAMKMEHTLMASVDGKVTAVHARQGQPVGLDDPVVTISAVEVPDKRENASQDEPEEQP